MLRFRYFLDRFCGFNVHFGMRIFRFLAFGFRILVKNTNGFSNLVSDVVLGFSPLGSGLSCLSLI